MIVDEIVLAGSCCVLVIVLAGSVSVLAASVTRDGWMTPGSVTVDSTVLAGGCCVNVNVLAAPGKVIVLPGNCWVIVSCKARVESIVLAGSAENTVLIWADPGKVRVEMSVETNTGGIIVLVMVTAGKEEVTRSV